jgi:hypothetical protein
VIGLDGAPACSKKLAAVQGRTVTDDVDVVVEFFRDVPDDVTASGHLVALSCPVGLADRLESSLAATNPVPS